MDYKNVVESADAVNQMLKHSDGRRIVPVLVENDNVTIGFGGT